MRPCRAIIGCALACCVTIAGVAGCGQKPPTSNAVTSDAAPRRVEVAKPVRKTIRRSITQPGQVEAFDQARLYAKVAGYVEKYVADIGDPVKAWRQLTGPALAELPELKEDCNRNGPWSRRPAPISSRPRPR